MRTWFVDTNVFLRFLTNDIPEQAEKVATLLRQASEQKVLLVTNIIVIAEIVWTLESYYGLSKADIAEKVLAILNTPGLEVEQADLVAEAVLFYADLNIDFADAFNAAWAKAHGITSICTFDRKHFNRVPDIKTLEPKE